MKKKKENKKYYMVVINLQWLQMYVKNERKKKQY